MEMYIFGIVSGISWFVFMEFMYVLYHNPDLVYNETSSYNNQGVPQIGNIFIHYYIVAATPMWTIFNLKYLHEKLADFRGYKALTFSLVWILYIIAYIGYWNFDIYGIMKNYHIEDEPLWQNCLYVSLITPVVTNANAIYLYCIQGRI